MKSIRLLGLFVTISASALLLSASSSILGATKSDENLCHLKEFFGKLKLPIEPERFGIRSRVIAQMGDEARCSVSFLSQSCVRTFFDRISTYSQLRHTSDDFRAIIARTENSVESTLRIQWTFTVKTGGVWSEPEFSSVETNADASSVERFQQLSEICSIASLPDNEFMRAMEELEASAHQTNAKFIEEQRKRYEALLKMLCQSALSASAELESSKSNPTAPITFSGYGGYASKAGILSDYQFVRECGDLGFRLPYP